MKTRMTGGEGWSLSSDDKSETTKKVNPRSSVPKIRLEKRAGKLVTVIYGLHTYGAARLEAMAKELKAKLGAGGTVKNGTVEIQGDKVVATQNFLSKR